ncbi:MAG: ATP-grasp domain-containing protein [Clostridium perfringens]|uniref:ATP-grasp domain-containing protein n=2 Tax=Clostridium perfringens TaxID=1502 RepID=A0AAP7BX56_CLOPF|nr:ATP-grasp domain-containing protein [Clostridium perfringens]WEV16551.1 ATP-grasp domain-containing protein [Clostridium perfringens D]EDT25114.1 pglb2 [Clostridium perfringens B str. ATCC 3626]EJT5933900.1 ATP-grasp domain-containing protein [Clostridium perfringens]EJT6154072.1 ATP-grasp domain-containing protein [Clostridium perfringens]MDM0893443.1 ATP-grasp domain-containing protein [Clostridium perfringens]
MQEINILFSSVGRRVELVNAFREASRNLNIKSNLIGIDIDELAPALKFVDKAYKVPPIFSEDFIPRVIEICRIERVSLIIPTLDTELLKYSKNKELIKRVCGAKVMVSEEETISIIRDKIKTHNFLKEKEFDVPKLITDKDIDNKDYRFPLFIKPLDGSSSINNFKINSEKELDFFKTYVKNPIIQEFINGDEYCVDVFSDFDGNVITIVPKLRIAHRGGEITKAKVIKDSEIMMVGKRLVKTLKLVGESNFDCIRSGNTIKIIEINGRFAGGSPISFKAGANSPENLYKIFLGEKLRYNEKFKDGVIALRFDSAVFI